MIRTSVEALSELRTLSETPPKTDEMGTASERASQEAQRAEKARQAAIAQTQGRVNQVFDSPARNAAVEVGPFETVASAKPATLGETLGDTFHMARTGFAEAVPADAPRRALNLLTSSFLTPAGSPRMTETSAPVARNAPEMGPANQDPIYTEGPSARASETHSRRRALWRVPRRSLRKSLITHV